MYSMNISGELGRSSLEFTDPTPDVHRLFCTFNDMFFYGKLGSVSVRWSKRMYTCAGICRYQKRIGFCDIALSEPLLKLRSRKDLIETLIHEMIHAYLFVTANNRDRDGHGPEFLSHMYRINKRANLNISVYHSFHSEVNLYKTHWWRCDGPCQKRKPFYGTVRRTMNRAPGPSDFWWQQHQFTCGGKFIKIKEPEKKKIKEPEKKLKTAKPSKPILTPSNNSLDKYFKGKPKESTDKANTNTASQSNSFANILKNENTSNVPVDNVNPRDAVRNHWADKYPSTKRKLEDSLTKTENVIESNSKRIKKTFEEEIPLHVQLNLSKEEFDDYNAILKDVYGEECSLNTTNYKPKSARFSKTLEYVNEDSIVPCPLCNNKFSKSIIETHVNHCLDSLPSSEIDLTEKKPIPSCTSTPFPSDEIDLTQNELIPSCTSTPLPSTSKRFFAKCPLCNIDVSGMNMEQHLESCVSGTFLQESNYEFNESASSKAGEALSLLSDDDSDDESVCFKVPCPCCLLLIEPDKINEHIDECLL